MPKDLGYSGGAEPELNGNPCDAEGFQLPISINAD